MPREKRVVTVSVRMPESYVEYIDELVSKGYYKNRSEAVRKAIKKLVHKYACVIKPRTKKMYA